MRKTLAMIFDFFLVCFVVIVFLIFFLNWKNRDLGYVIAKIQFFSLLSGGIITIVKIIMLFSQFEIMLENQYYNKGMTENQLSKNEYLYYFDTNNYLGFFMLILVQFIPLLFGLLIKLILEPIVQNLNKKSLEKTEKGIFEEQSTDEKIVEKKIEVVKSLSSRETEVAKLAAKGYSNMEIAEELFISVETVKRHLSTIFDKLNINSRKEIKNFFE